MIAHTSRPHCWMSQIVIGDLSLWHIVLPSGTLIHPITYDLGRSRPE